MNNTIDMTPTWESLSLHIAALAIEGTTYESKRIGREELTRMAKLADQTVSQGRQPSLSYQFYRQSQYSTFREAQQNGAVRTGETGTGRKSMLACLEGMAQVARSMDMDEKIMILASIGDEVLPEQSLDSLINYLTNNY